MANYIGNSTGNTLTKATLTAGDNITITNGSGSIEIAASSSAPSYFLYDDFRHGLYTNTGYIISSNPYAYLVANTTATSSTSSSGLNCTISQASGSTNSIQMFRYDTLVMESVVYGNCGAVVSTGKQCISLSWT